VQRSFLNLYRALGQPAAFNAETRGLRPGARFGFMVRMVPSLLVLQMVVGGVVALVAHLLHAGRMDWWQQGLGMAVLSSLMAIGWGWVWNVTFAVAWGAVWGTAAWAATALLAPLVFGPDPAGEWVVRWLPLALASGVGLGNVMGSNTGLIWGLVLWTGIGAATTSLPMLVIILTSFVIGFFRIETFPLDMAATLWQLAAARRDPKQARARLRHSPIYWREPIWVTLPGIRSFLRLVGEQDFAAGVQECLFAVARHPGQAQAARVALTEVIADHLAHLSSVAQIAASAEELGHATAERQALPGMLEGALPGLEGLAQHATQYVTALLPHNRRRALERLRDGAGDLARQLALSADRASRLLVDVPTRWQEVAAAELAEMGEAERDTGYVHNPFIFGQPIEETDTNLFVGRRDTVKEIEVSLLGGEQKPALVMWGPRRMGKTSVLLQLPRLLGPTFVPAFVDMQSVQVRESLPAFFHSLTSASARALRRRGCTVAGLEIANLGENPFTAFSEWMEEVGQQLGPERHLLLCLDEFERLEASIREQRLPSELMDEIRHIIQHHPRIVLLFAGSHRPDELDLNWPDTLISTKLIRVGYLSAEDAEQLVTHPVPDFAISYAPGAVARVLELTRCQPYLVQALCYELVNHLNVAGRREATVEDVQAGLERALESAHLYFAEMWRQFPENQRILLEVLAERPEGEGVDTLAKAARSTPELVRMDLKRLESRSTLEQIAHTDRWRYQVPMVASWVVRQGE
jgi:uncharacterized protein